MRKLMIVIMALLPLISCAQSYHKKGVKIGNDSTLIDSVYMGTDTVFFKIIEVGGDTTIFYLLPIGQAYPGGGGGPADPDSMVTAFLAATGLGGTDSLAVDYIVNALQDSGLLEYYLAIYLVAGGTANTHKYNLLDTSAYQLLYGLGVTHSANGMQGNMTSQGYANTQFFPTVEMVGDVHLSFFTNTDSIDGTTNIDIGHRDTNNNTQYIISSSGNVIYDQTHYARMGGNSVYYPATKTKGYYYVVATDTSTSMFRDGVKTMYSTLDGGPTITGYSVYILAGRNSLGNTTGGSPQRCITATVGYAMTDDQVYTASNIFRTFNAMIGRPVDSTYIGRPKSTYPLTLLELEADAEPTKGYDGDLAAWDTLPDHSAMISWNTRAYIPSGDLSFAQYGASPYIIDVDSIDVGAWLRPLDSVGVELVYFTLIEAHGFSLDVIPDSIAFPARLIDKYNGYVKYDPAVNPNMDLNVYEMFYDTCIALGIIPVPYFNSMRNLNLQPNSGFAHMIWDSTDCVHYNNWMAKYMQYILIKYPTTYVWIDGWRGEYLDIEDKAMVTDYQLLYNAIKAVDTSIMVVMNEWADTSYAWPDSSFIRYPYDIGSSEEWVMENLSTKSDAQVADTNMVHWGETYNIPKEFIMNIADDPSATFWYATSDEGTTVRPASECQDFYDRAVAVGAKFCLSVIPGRNGIVQQSQFQVWRDLNF